MRLAIGVAVFVALLAPASAGALTVATTPAAEPGFGSDRVTVIGGDGSERVFVRNPAGPFEIEGSKPITLAPDAECEQPHPKRVQCVVDSQALVAIETRGGDDGVDLNLGTSLRLDARTGGGDDLVQAERGFERSEAVIRGGAGDDVLLASPGIGVAKAGLNLLFGGAGEDVLRGSDHRDVIDGGNGADVATGRGGSDRLLMRDGHADFRIDCGGDRNEFVRVDRRLEHAVGC